jgi:hypothetical protein
MIARCGYTLRVTSQASYSPEYITPTQKKNEKSCCENSKDKIAVCEKTAGLRSGNFSDLNSACSKVLVPVKIFQFQDMGNESERYRDAANGLKMIAYCISDVESTSDMTCQTLDRR